MVVSAMPFLYWNITLCIPIICCMHVFTPLTGCASGG
uniref:Uncharacterized protein n=1 Tax=Anguilla anguilla TaxID=7936 RepID=A0A0E9U9U4_ANGAN